MPDTESAIFIFSHFSIEILKLFICQNFTFSSVDYDFLLLAGFPKNLTVDINQDNIPQDTKEFQFVEKNIA